MKTEPKFKVSVDREDVAEHLKGIDVLANLESNGKLEATFILKGWYETFEGLSFKVGFINNVKYLIYAFLVVVSFIFLISFPIFFPFYTAAAVLYFFDFQWFSVFLFTFLGFLVSFPILFVVSCGIANMFTEWNALDNVGLKIKNKSLEVFAKKIGFSFLKPNIKDMQSIQDFFIWMASITKNIEESGVVEAREEVSRGEKTEVKEAKGSEFDWWNNGLEKLKNYDLKNEKDFKMLMFEAFKRIPDTIDLIVKSKEYKLIWESVVNETTGVVIGDLTAGNKDRLLQKFANGG